MQIGQDPGMSRDKRSVTGQGIDTCSYNNELQLMSKMSRYFFSQIEP